MEYLPNGHTVHTVRMMVDFMLTDTRIDSIVRLALEDSSLHWCSGYELVGKQLGEYPTDQISRNGTLKLYDKKDGVHELTLSKFLVGLRLWIETESLLCPDDDDRIYVEQIDSDAADLIIQYALFNEAVYV